MTAKGTLTVSAIVLRFNDYGESDRIVTFYTEDRGKLKGIAKGARKSQKRFANAIEPFSLSTIYVSRRRNEGLYLIENCDVTNHFPSIRSNLEKTLIASYFIELTDHFTVEEKRSRALFEHVKDFLHLLEGGHPTESIIRLFELRLLMLSGYEPILEACIRCGTSINEIDRAFFNPADGGIRCMNCAQSAQRGRSVSRGTLKTLIAGKNITIARLNRLVFTGQSLRESSEILIPLIRYTLRKEPKSLKVLRDIRNLTP